MDINNLFTETVNKMQDDGSLESLVREQITSTVQSMLKDMFGRYSEIGKKVKKLLEEKIGFNPENIPIPQFNKLVEQLITDALLGGPLEEYKEQVQRIMEGLNLTLEKKEWKLSEIVRKFREGSYSSGGRYYCEIEESDYGTIYIGFDTENRNGRVWDFDYVLSVEARTGRFWNFHHHKKGALLQLQEPLLGAFHKFIFSLYANDVKIIIDGEWENELSGDYD